MSNGFQNALNRFNRDERGAIAILFAGAIMLMLLMCSLAIDFARAVHAKWLISASIDAAALAGAKGLRLQNMSKAEVETLAKKIFNENYNANGLTTKGVFADIKAVNVDVDSDNGAVTITVDAVVDTTFGAVAGIDKFDLRNSGAAIFESMDIEVGVQLDVTGSMGGQKIADLKLATKDLIDALIPDTPTGQKVRVGLAPFAAGINAGIYASAVNGGVAAPDNCVYERVNTNYQDTDNAPAGQAALKTKLDLPSASSCPNAAIQPLTDNKAQLKTIVDSYSTGGCTAGHLGTAWSWYLLAPSWSSVWPTASKPDSYSSGKTKKIAILMTDGECNTVGGISTCNKVTASSDFATDTCAAMKASGIIVYTVGFKLDDATAIATMNTCASGADKAYEAKNGAELRQAFRDIAEQITRLRLSS